MLDRFSREINYLRISVTDRCNLRCIYCMPAEGIQLKDRHKFLTFEQIEMIVQEATKIGINKIRLTGGEPLVRKHIEDLVFKIARIDGVKELSLTTNGVLLGQKAKILKKMGVNRINISLDTLDTEKYRKITRIGEIRDVLAGIDAALREDIPVKINMVVMNDTNKDEITAMAKFCKNKGTKLQLINRFYLDQPKDDSYQTDRPPRCQDCNRIRLLADGFLRPCLFSDFEKQIDFNDILGSLQETIFNKPEKGSCCKERRMSQIGG